DPDDHNRLGSRSGHNPHFRYRGRYSGRSAGKIVRAVRYAWKTKQYRSRPGDRKISGGGARWKNFGLQRKRQRHDGGYSFAKSGGITKAASVQCAICKLRSAICKLTVDGVTRGRIDLRSPIANLMHEYPVV